LPVASLSRLVAPAAAAKVTKGFITADFWRKLDVVFSVFDDYDRVFDVACLALFLCLFGWLAWTRRLGLVPRLGWPFASFSVATC
jgi:hypothetical protein